LRHKTSAELSEITSGLDSDVIKKGSAISVSIKYKYKLFVEPLIISVGDYQVTLDAKGSRDAPDIYLSCSCSYWRYQGPEYHALRNNYLYGKPRGTAEKPKQRDPKGSHKLCKHAYAVVKSYF